MVRFLSMRRVAAAFAAIVLIGSLLLLAVGVRTSAKFSAANNLKHVYFDAYDSGGPVTELPDAIRLRVGRKSYPMLSVIPMNYPRLTDEEFSARDLPIYAVLFTPFGTRQVRAEDEIAIFAKQVLLYGNGTSADISMRECMYITRGGHVDFGPLSVNESRAATRPGD